MIKQRVGELALIIGCMTALAWLALVPRLEAQSLANVVTSPSASALVVTQAAESPALVHTAEITFTPAFTTYLPLVSSFIVLPPAGIHGQVTYQGAPITNVEIQLILWHKTGNGWASSSGDTLYTSTDADGRYQFATADSLDADQKYTVRFMNTTHDARFLEMWQSIGLYTYTAGQVLAGGDFEIAEMLYLSPSYGAYVSLPVTFQWQLRTGAPSDSYVLEMYKPNNSTIWFDTPKLGYTGTYLMNSLPTGFTTGVQYGWYVWVYGPGDSYGITNQYGAITFH